MEKAKFKQEFVSYLLLIIGSALFAAGDVMLSTPI